MGPLYPHLFMLCSRVRMFTWKVRTAMWFKCRNSMQKQRDGNPNLAKCRQWRSVLDQQCVCTLTPHDKHRCRTVFFFCSKLRVFLQTILDIGIRMRMCVARVCNFTQLLHTWASPGSFPGRGMIFSQNFFFAVQHKKFKKRQFLQICANLGRN